MSWFVRGLIESTWVFVALILFGITAFLLPPIQYYWSKWKDRWLKADLNRQIHELQNKFLELQVKLKLETARADAAEDRLKQELYNNTGYRP